MTTTNTAKLPMADVYANPNQPRKVFEPTSLQELADSIRENGLIQPITVRPDGEGRYMIVCGERRFRAHQLNKAATISAMVVDMSDDDLADRAIIENLQRKDITPLEEAAAYQARLDTGISVEKLAKKLGLKQAWRITERTNLLKLTDEMQEALRCKIIGLSQAQELSRLTGNSQRLLFKAIRDGKCGTYNQLRATANALFAADNQASMFAAEAPAPTEKEKKTAKGLLSRIEKVASVLSKGFDDNEVIIARKVSPLEADIAAEKLELIEAECRKLRHALRAAAVVQSGQQEIK
jgi:ParB family chromosome partitioning protein